ncbi:pyridoxal phosphate-dependent transferase [Lipomyces japonicus]|uniref:pyridoxal phosphate-dependent transferase n=1 Tax=Lipomyces japonicus TaxID=56871 RepID=UPI0034CE34E7
MPLSRHVDPKTAFKTGHGQISTRTHHVPSPYINRYISSEPIPKYLIPENGVDAKAAYQLIADDLELDGKPNLNMASFVSTFIEDEALKLTVENLTKNLADSDEYPALLDIHARCISILGELWHAKPDEKPIGSATTGSSEAIHLGGLAMKRRWQEKRKAEGKDTSRPNIIMGANAQVALEKFARYFEVEPRLVPVSDASFHCLDVDQVRANVDENTIGVFVILGSTYTGHYEPVKAVSDVLDEYEKQTGHSVPIHVDAASGGFVAPFSHQSVEWDFRLPRVHSINVSGHKYGLVTAGLGWIIWRSEDFLPKYLVFELKYLGGVEQSFTLNFSRPGAQVVQQYYNFLHLGREGYRRIQNNSLANARHLSWALERSGYFQCLSEIHRPRGSRKFDAAQAATVDLSQLSSDPEDYNPGLPVVSWRLTDAFREQYPHVKQQAISTLLRVKGYIIPNYPLPPNQSDVEILRVVVRESLSADAVDRLAEDIVTVTESLVDASDVDVTALAQPLHRLALASGRHSRVETSLGQVSREGSRVDLSEPDAAGATNKALHKHHQHGYYKGVC